MPNRKCCVIVDLVANVCMSSDLILVLVNSRSWTIRGSRLRELVARLPAPMGAGGDGRSVDHGENDGGHDNAMVLCLFDAGEVCWRTGKMLPKGNVE